MLSCIKCSTKYESAETEPYYCLPCLNAKKDIADKIDAKFAGRSRIKSKTLLDQYNEAPRAKGGFPDARYFL